MARLGKEDILKASDLPTEECDCPEWGGTVLVRGMSGRERDDFEAKSMTQVGDQMMADPGNIRARLVAQCVIDEDTGQRMFTDGEAETLGAKSARAITRVAEVAARLSGLGEDAAKEMAANFGPPGPGGNGAGGGSSSSLPATSAKPSKDSSAK